MSVDIVIICGHSHNVYGHSIMFMDIIKMSKDIVMMSMVLESKGVKIHIKHLIDANQSVSSSIGSF